MNMDADETRLTWVGKLVSVLIVIALIGAGIDLFLYLKSKKEKMKRQPVKKQAVMVETMIMQSGSFKSRIKAMGTVVPDNQVELKSQVGGKVVFISPDFVRGGIMKKGRFLLNIDDTDYQIAVKKAQSVLDKALSDLEIEKGSQMIAMEELKMINEADLGEVKATDLALRKPQLVQAKAAVDSARADLEQAKLNLSRTQVLLPFNALVLEKKVNLGSLVATQGIVAVLVNVDAYRVETLVPPDKLGVLKFNAGTGSRALVHSQYSGRTWEGIVERTTGTMATDSRMAGVIILVKDPLGLNRPDSGGPLLLDDHVEVEMMGNTFENVFSLSWAYLRDDDTVWIYSGGKLDIRTVELAWKEDGIVFIRSGINPGDQLVTSELPAPVQGMALQTAAGDRK